MSPRSSRLFVPVAAVLVVVGSALLLGTGFWLGGGSTDRATATGTSPIAGTASENQQETLDSEALRTEARGASSARSLDVRVVAGGSAIAGARVRAFAFDRSLGAKLLSFLREESSESEKPDPLCAATTDSIGRASLDPADGPVLVVVDAPGYASAGSVLESGRGALEIALEPGHSLHCRVTAYKGVLPSHVRLRVVPSIRDLGRPGVERQAMDARNLALWLAPPLVERRPEGGYSITAIPEGFVRVEAGAEGFLTDGWDLEIPWRGLGGVCYIVLRHEARVMGTVWDRDGLPVAGAQVLAWFPDYDEGVVWRHPVRTGADGSFWIPVPAERGGGGIVVVGDGKGSARVPLPSLRKGEEREIPVRLVDPVLLEGRVTTPDGRGLEGVVVSVYRRGTTIPAAIGESDESGRISCDVGEAGVYDIDLFCRGYEAERTSGVAVPGDPIELVMTPMGRIRGTVQVGDQPADSGVVHLIHVDPQGAVHLFLPTPIGEDGRFRFSNVPAGSDVEYTLVATVPGKGMAQRQGIVVVPEGQEGELIDLIVGGPGEGVVTGIVADRASGRPIVGAEVRLVFSWDGLEARTYTTLPLAATTDDQGVYRFEGIPRSVFLGVTARHPGYAEETKVVGPVPGDEATVCDLALRKSCAVRFQVFDLDGEPLSHYEIDIAAEDGAVRNAIADRPVFVVDDMPPGDALVGISLFSHERPEMNGQFIRRRMHMEAGATVDAVFPLSELPRVRGRIIGDVGRGRRFSAFLVGRPRTHWYSSRRVPESNEFLLLAAEPGTYDFVVESYDEGPVLRAMTEVDLEAGEERLVGFEWPDTQLLGSVVDTEGKPVGGAWVRLARQGSRQALAGDTVNFHRALVGADGAFAVGGLEPGTYTYIVLAVGFGMAGGTVEVPEDKGDGEPPRLDIVLAPGAILRVRATDTGRRALTPDRVYCGKHPPVDGLPWQVARRDESGRDVIEDLAPGDYRLRVLLDGFFPSVSTVHCDAGEQRDVEVVLRRTGSILVRLRDASGRPLAGLPFEIRDVQTGELASDWIAQRRLSIAGGILATGEEGEVRVKGLPEGELAVLALGQERRVRVDPDAAEDASVTIQAIP